MHACEFASVTQLNIDFVITGIDALDVQRFRIANFQMPMPADGDHLLACDAVGYADVDRATDLFEIQFKISGWQAADQHQPAFD